MLAIGNLLILATSFSFGRSAEIPVKKYQSEIIEESSFDFFSYDSVELTSGSNLLCAVNCLGDDSCLDFQLNAQTCKLGSSSVSSVTPTTPVTVFKTPIIPACPKETTDVSYLITTAEEKSSWKTDNSPDIYNGLDARYLIDGDYTNLYHTRTVTSPSFHWVQIDVGSMQWVKGVKLTNRDQSYKMPYKEIRVGNTDIAGAAMDTRLCLNQLCYRTGGETEVEQHVQCATPLLGRFVTVQRYQQGDMDMHEIDVEVYCDLAAVLEPVGEVCLAKQVDACARTVVGTEVYSSAAHKATWVMTSSTVYMDNHYPDYAKDGIYTTSNTSPFTLFHTLRDANDPYPWLQIDFQETKAVKAVNLYGRTDGTNTGAEMRFTEVRIGDVDAGAVTAIGDWICVNELCKTTGAEAIIYHEEDCSSPPLSGRYVTLQRKNLDRTGITHLAMGEVDVIFYQ